MTRAFLGTVILPPHVWKGKRGARLCESVQMCAICCSEFAVIWRGSIMLIDIPLYFATSGWRYIVTRIEFWRDAKKQICHYKRYLQGLRQPVQSLPIQGSLTMQIWNGHVYLGFASGRLIPAHTPQGLLGRQGHLYSRTTAATASNNFLSLCET